jgi:hypothetical protein
MHREAHALAPFPAVDAVAGLAGVSPTRMRVSAPTRDGALDPILVFKTPGAPATLTVSLLSMPRASDRDAVTSAAVGSRLAAARVLVPVLRTAFAGDAAAVCACGGAAVAVPVGAGLYGPFGTAPADPTAPCPVAIRITGPAARVSAATPLQFTAVIFRSDCCQLTCQVQCMQLCARERLRYRDLGI